MPTMTCVHVTMIVFFVLLHVLFPVYTPCTLYQLISCSFFYVYCYVCLYYRVGNFQGVNFRGYAVFTVSLVNFFVDACTYGHYATVKIGPLEISCCTVVLLKIT